MVDEYPGDREDAFSTTGHGGLALCHVFVWNQVAVARPSLSDQSGQTVSAWGVENKGPIGR